MDHKHIADGDIYIYILCIYIYIYNKLARGNAVWTPV